MMTRDEHLAWAKARALEYVSQDDLTAAVLSMASDLTKWRSSEGEAMYDPRLIDVAVETGLLFEIPRGPEAVRRWVEGFN
jgi:hypothetical protein